MKLIKYVTPVNDLLSLNERFNRTFGDFLKDYNDELFSSAWLPAVDITENDESYEIKAELPGLKKEDVKITVHDNVLTLKGEKKEEKEERKKGCHRGERTFGSFVRSFSLGARVDNNRIQADFKDGVLTVTLPKTMEAKVKEIEVKVQ
jgi:HSP20 family protein